MREGRGVLAQWTSLVRFTQRCSLTAHKGLFGEMGRGTRQKTSEICIRPSPSSQDDVPAVIGFKNVQDFVPISCQGPRKYCYMLKD
jgi:hypothetical protein